MYRNLIPREEKMLEFLNAYGEQNLVMAMQNQANIDYVAMMTDVPLPDEEEEPNA